MNCHLSRLILTLKISSKFRNSEDDGPKGLFLPSVYLLAGNLG